MGLVLQHSGFIELLPSGDPQPPTLEIYLSSGKCAGYFNEARKRNQSTNFSHRRHRAVPCSCWSSCLPQE